MTKEWSTALTPEVSRDGTKYRARVIGFEREDGKWEGRLEFRDNAGRTLRTGHETTQPNLTTLQYWATGLEQIYLDGALQRAAELEAKGR